MNMCYSAMIQRKLKPFGIEIDTLTEQQYEELFLFRCEQNPKKFKAPTASGRVFPYYFAPVLIFENGKYFFIPMRYQIYPATFRDDPKHLSLFNARKDNLLKSSIWNRLIGKRQGLAFIDHFYEWVQARDLLNAGSVTLKELEAKFEALENHRRQLAIATGKNYRLSKTALTPPIERKVEIVFQPTALNSISAPVVYDIHIVDGFPLYSFAIITDLPQPEVAAAGHDRSPIFLQNEAAIKWLSPHKYSVSDNLKNLDNVAVVTYLHKLSDAAV